MVTQTQEPAKSTLMAIANKLTRLALVRNKDEKWKEKWDQMVRKFMETVEPILGEHEEDEHVFVIEDYGHNTLVFSDHGFALKLRDGSWVFINPTVYGHQYIYDTLIDMLNAIYTYSRAYVFKDFIFVLDADAGIAKMLKPLGNEPRELQPILVPPNANEQERRIIEVVNRLIDMNNHYLCIHPFSIVSGCYGLAKDLLNAVREYTNAPKNTDFLYFVVRPPYNGTPFAITNEEKIKELVWRAFTSAVPYDPCGDANCDYLFIVNDLDVLLIVVTDYYLSHRFSDLAVEFYTFKITITLQLIDNNKR